MKWLLLVESAILAGGGLYVVGFSSIWCGLAVVAVGMMLLFAAMDMFDEEEQQRWE